MTNDQTTNNRLTNPNPNARSLIRFASLRIASLRPIHPSKTLSLTHSLTHQQHKKSKASAATNNSPADSPLPPPQPSKIPRTENRYFMQTQNQNPLVRPVF